MPKKANTTAKTGAAKRNASKPAKTAQIKITLLHSDPPIWRRFLVSHDVYLDDLHYLIQTAMGWGNDHMHYFHDGKQYYQPEIHDDYGDSGPVDETEYRLSDLRSRPRGKLRYRYDFGDCWDVEILIEKLITEDKPRERAEPLAGGGASPPDDCGGIWGYYNLVKAANNPKHPDHDYAREWLRVKKGGKFDPAAFDIRAIS